MLQFGRQVVLRSRTHCKSRASHVSCLNSSNCACMLYRTLMYAPHRQHIASTAAATAILHRRSQLHCYVQLWRVTAHQRRHCTVKLTAASAAYWKQAALQRAVQQWREQCSAGLLQKQQMSAVGATAATEVQQVRALIRALGHWRARARDSAAAKVSLSERKV
jgi:hypothetical protein